MGGPQKSAWADPEACSSLCQLMLDDWRGRRLDDRAVKRRRALPPALYVENVAPFLRFDAPLPNMLYAFGGRDQRRGPLDVVEMFDTWNGCWVPRPPMPTRRAGSAAALLPDDRIIVIGGYNERGIAEGLLASCDVYHPSKESWESAAPLARARWGHGAAFLRGRVFVVGGCSLQPDAQPRESFMETLKICEAYDPLTDRWKRSAPLQVARSGSRVVALGDRYLAAVGGCDDVFGRAETQPTVELYDGSTGQWSLLGARLAHPRTTAAIAAIDARNIIVVGGAPSLSSAELFQVPLPDSANDSELATRTDVLIADMPEGRMGCQAAVVDLPGLGGAFPLTSRRCVVVIGGERCEESHGAEWPRVRQFASVPTYDIQEMSWRQDEVVPPMDLARTAVALCVGVGRTASSS